MAEEAASREAVLALFAEAGAACDAAYVKWAIEHRWAMDLHGLPAPPDKFVACMLVGDFSFQRLLREGLFRAVLWAGGGYGRLHLGHEHSGAFISCAHAARPFDDLVLQHAVRTVRPASRVASGGSSRADRWRGARYVRPAAQ